MIIYLYYPDILPIEHDWHTIKSKIRSEDFVMS